MIDMHDQSADEQALRELFQQMQDGWNQGNGQAMAAPFTDDADYIIWNGLHLKGRQAIASMHQEIFETFYQGSRLEGSIRSIRFLSDDIALLHLHGRPLLPGQTLPAPEQHSIQTLIAIRLPQGWRFTAFQNTLMQQERS
jgi:uncharacterized protein (TIGR02246 family)